MMNLYTKHILPYILDFTMRSKRFESERKSVIEKAYGKVLEIGFGSGVNIPYYKNIEELFALEPSEELFNLTKDKPSFVLTYVKAYAEEIPFPDHTFDTVVSTWTMCTIPDPERALQEIRRVLKPHGRFIFIEHGKSPHTFWATLQTFFTPVSKKCAGGCHLDRDIPGLIKGIGFKQVNIETIHSKCTPLAYMYKGHAKM